MKIVFLTPDEPFYLPDFYKYILENISPEHAIKVVIVPPTYKNTTKLDLTIRYAKTFGFKEAAILSYKVIFYKIMNLLPNGNNGRFYSLSSLLKRYEIPYVYEDDVNSTSSLNRLKEWGAELIISVSCPQIFKKDLINLPQKGCLNLHGSILPDYRGVMPSFWVLANNEKESGATLFFVNEKIDAGDILIQRTFLIGTEDTLDSQICRSKRLGAEMVVEAIEKINRGEVETQPLDVSNGNYYGWPKRGDVIRFIKLGRRFR